MAAVVMVMAVVAICMLGDTVMAGVVTRMVVMVGQAMLITDLLMATVMVAPATVMDTPATVMPIMGIMAGGIMVTGTPAMVAGGAATGTHMALEPVGVSGQAWVGFGSATNRNAWSQCGFYSSRGQGRQDLWFRISPPAERNPAPSYERGRVSCERLKNSSFCRPFKSEMECSARNARSYLCGVE